MSVLRSGLRSVLFYCALSALIGVGGCASTQAPSYVAQNSAPRVVAQAAPTTEDDGLPAQAPPPAYIRQLPDDPSEPFSPNYGGGNPAAMKPPPSAKTQPQQQAQAVRVPVPDDLPPAFRNKLVTALRQDE